MHTSGLLEGSLPTPEPVQSLMVDARLSGLLSKTAWPFFRASSASCKVPVYDSVSVVMSSPLSFIDATTAEANANQGLR